MDRILLSSILWDDVEILIEKTVLRAIQSQHSASENAHYISIKTACEILSVSRQTVNEYINKGKLKRYKIGSTTRLLRSDVLSIVEPEQ